MTAPHGLVTMPAAGAAELAGRLGPAAVVVTPADIDGVLERAEEASQARWAGREPLAAEVEEADDAVRSAIEALTAAQEERDRTAAALAAFEPVVERLDRAEAELANARKGVDEAKVEARLARAAQARAEEWRTIIRTLHDEERARLDASDEEAAAALAEGGPDADTETELAREEAERAAGERDAAGALVADLEAAATARAEALAAGRATSADLRARLAEQDAADPGPVRSAVLAFDEAAADAEPDPDAATLAARWDQWQADVAALDRAEGPLPTDEELGAAERKLAETAETVAAAETAAKSGSVSATQRALIEAAQQEVYTAERGASGRFGAAAARKRLADANAVLEEVLGQAGFGSYLDYLMAGHTVDTAREEELERAGKALMAAETELATLRTRTETSPARAALDEIRWSLRRETRAILGFDPGANAPGLLRSHPHVPAEIIRRLSESLTEAGVLPGDQPLIATATAWLTTHDEQSQATTSLVRDLAEADARVAVLEDGAAQERVLEMARTSLRLSTDQAAHAERLARRLEAAREDRHARAAISTVDDGRRWRLTVLDELEESIGIGPSGVASRARAAVEAAERRVREADTGLSEAEDAVDPLLGKDWAPGDPPAHLAELRAAAAAAADITGAEGQWERAAHNREVLVERLAAYDRATAEEPHDLSSAVAWVWPGATAIWFVDTAGEATPAAIESLRRLARTRLVVYATDRVDQPAAEETEEPASTE